MPELYESNWCVISDTLMVSQKRHCKNSHEKHYSDMTASEPSQGGVVLYYTPTTTTHHSSNYLFHKVPNNNQSGHQALKDILRLTSIYTGIFTVTLKFNGIVYFYGIFVN